VKAKVVGCVVVHAFGKFIPYPEVAQWAEAQGVPLFEDSALGPVMPAYPFDQCCSSLVGFSCAIDKIPCAAGGCIGLFKDDEPSRLLKQEMEEVMATWDHESPAVRLGQLAKELLTMTLYGGFPMAPLLVGFVGCCRILRPSWSLNKEGLKYYKNYTTVHKGSKYDKKTLAYQPDYALQTAMLTAVRYDYKPLVKRMVECKTLFWDEVGVEPAQLKPWMCEGDAHPEEFYDMIVANDMAAFNDMQDEINMLGSINVTWNVIMPVEHGKQELGDSTVCQWYCKNMGRVCILHGWQDWPLKQMAKRFKAGLEKHKILPLKLPTAATG